MRIKATLIKPAAKWTAYNINNWASSAIVDQDKMLKNLILKVVGIIKTELNLI